MPCCQLANPKIRVDLVGIRARTVCRWLQSLWLAVCAPRLPFFGRHDCIASLRLKGKLATSTTPNPTPTNSTVTSNTRLVNPTLTKPTVANPTLANPTLANPTLLEFQTALS